MTATPEGGAVGPPDSQHVVEQCTCLGGGGVISLVSCRRRGCAARRRPAMRTACRWFHLPAILKGWVDRVFALGWAFGRGPVTATRFTDRCSCHSCELFFWCHGASVWCLGGFATHVCSTDI